VKMFEDSKENNIQNNHKLSEVYKMPFQKNQVIDFDWTKCEWKISTMKNNWLFSLKSLFH